ncbi:hypothetical protein G9A89_015946 [Geosiphon pyriformis]|nr:hypothetical protein G9A89_015946 [Geosiphon pyriformis]
MIKPNHFLISRPLLKVAKESGADKDFKPVLSRKKKKGITLEESISEEKMPTETGDTTESESINMEKKCLVEETSFDYGENRNIVNEDYDQMPKEPGVKTKKMLGKPLEKIDFLGHNNDDNALLNVPLELSPPLKNLVTVFVRKSFTMDIKLDKMAEKSSQKKLVVSMVLEGGASTPSKFSGIIHVSFTSKASLTQVTEKARAADILAVVVKKIPVETLAETVCAALSEFGSIKAVVEFAQLNQADLVAARWSILIRKNAMRVAKTNADKKSWNTRDQHKALLYILPIDTNVRCAVVCFNSAASINVIIETTPVLKDANLHWSYMNFVKCTKYENLGHTSLSCSMGGKTSPSGPTHRILSNDDKNRLAFIYARHSAPISCFVSFGGVLWANIVGGSLFPSLLICNVSTSSGFSSEIKPTPIMSMKLNNRFAAFKCSFTSLVEYIDKLAKRLDSPGPMVSQPSPGCQLLVIFLSQNQKVDIVMSEDSDVTTGGEIIAGVVVFGFLVISKMEETLNNLLIMVMGLSAKIDNASLVSAVHSSQ